MAPAAKLNAEASHVKATRLSLEKAWERRRKWSRTDTARYLNDRSAPVLAVLRRRPGDWPRHSNSVGYWLREHAPQLFDRAHVLLTSLPSDEARENALTPDLL